MSKSKKVLKWLALGSFFFEMFFLFLYWTFPYEDVRDWVIREVEFPKDSRGVRHSSGWELEVLSLEPSWFTGVELEGVRVTKVSEDSDDSIPGFIYFPNVTARVGLFSLLIGEPSVSFETELAGGTIEGDFEKREQGFFLDAQIQNVNLRQVAILRSAIGVPVFGIANMNVYWDMRDDPKAAEGKVSGEIAGLSLGDGKAQIKLPGMDSGLTLEKMDLGKLLVSAKAEKGVLQVDTLEADGTHLGLMGKGSIKLQKEIMRSTLDLLLRVEIKKAYRDLSLKTQGLSMLLDTSPQLAAARTSDKALQYRLTGSLKNPRPKGAKRETFKATLNKPEDEKTDVIKEVDS